MDDLEQKIKKSCESGSSTHAACLGNRNIDCGYPLHRFLRLRHLGEGSFPSPLVSQFYHRLGGCVNETDRIIHCGTYLPDRRVGRCGVWPGPADL